MSFLANIKVSHKLAFLVICVFVVLALISALSISKLNQASAQTSVLADEKTGLIGLVDNGRHLQALFKELRICAIKYPMTVTVDERAAQKTAFARNKQNFLNVLIAAGERCNGNKECETIASRMSDDLDSYEKATFNEVIRLAEEGQNREAYLAIQKYLVPIGNDIDAGVDKLISIAADETKSVLTEMENVTNYVSFLCIAVAGGLLAVFLTNAIGVSIMRPIRRLSKDADEVAAGNLALKIDTSSRDEIGALSRSFSSMVEHLRGIIHDINTDSARLSQKSQLLISSSNSVSDSSEQILQQSMAVAAASEEMANTAKEVSQNCSEASSYSAEVQNIVKTGVDQVRATVEKIRDHSVQTNESAELINRLGQQTQQISGIISTIQDIAEQTNLLALNAAIEAARAGEHGRGFAVVADEVRSLAARTSGSTKEISAMINSVQDMVSQATTTMQVNVRKMSEIADDTNAIEDSLNSINTSVETVHEQLIHIAAATEEQTATSQEMSSNMQIISDATSRTVNDTRSSLDMSREIEQISGSMSEKVNMFSL